MTILNKTKDILDILLADRWIIPEQASQIREQAKKTGKTVDQILEEAGFIPEENLIRAYGKLYRLPFINLENFFIPYKTIQKIPENIAKKNLIVVFEEKKNKIKVATAKPTNLREGYPGVLTQIKKNYRLEPELYLTTRRSIESALKNYSQRPIPRRLKVSQETVPTRGRTRNILDVLLAQQIINQKQYTQIAQKASDAGKDPETYLREKKLIAADVLAKAQGILYNLPYVSLKEIKIKPEVLAKFPLDICQNYEMVVFDIVGNLVFKVATSRPGDPQVHEILDFVKKRGMADVDLFVTTKDDIQKSLDLYSQYEAERQKRQQKFMATKAVSNFQAGNQPRGVIITETIKQPLQTITPVSTPTEETPPKAPEEVGELDIGALIPQDIKDVSELSNIISSGAIPKIVAAVINFALNKRASDIHLEPTDKDAKIRYRIDGILRDIIFYPKDLHPAIVARIKISAHMRIDEQRIPQDGRFDVNFHGHAVDMRISSLPTTHGEKIEIRLLDKSKGIMTLEQLGLTGVPYQRTIRSIRKPFGMVLATGPTGSGKTTTLYAIIQFINTSEINIVTLEDPVEYEIPGVNHCQVRPEIGFSFADGLRSILRQDPNVIMVGEIRDKVTAAMAIHSALTGHLVLSSLHTNNASGAIPRLIDMGIEPFLIISSLQCVIAQRLVRRICEKCKEEITLPPHVINDIEKELAAISPKAQIQVKRPLKFWRGKGCDACTAGYSGRIGIFEILEMSPQIGQLAIAKASESAIKKQAMIEGMVTIKQDGILKTLEGITTIDEVYRVTTTAE